MNITVYLGATPGNDPALAEQARELGRWIGESGNALVYGGSRVGLMGQLALAAMAAGARVTGVEPEIFMKEELQLEGLDELISTKGMAERRSKMIELGDAFVAFPGGVGTLDEISEVMCLLALGQLDAPCVFLNLGGYYDCLRAQLNHMVEMGLCTPERLAHVSFVDSIEELAELLG